MRSLATVGVAALLLAVWGCSPDTDPPDATSAPTRSGTPASSDVGTPTPSDGQYDVDCVAVPADMARRISSGEKEGVDMVAGLTVAVKARDVENVYLVAMQFRVSGVAETQLGVWAIWKSLELGEQGRILAVDTSARSFTAWPDAGGSPVDVKRASLSISEVKACLLS